MSTATIKRFGAPAAVVGTLAAVLTVAPAEAEEPRPLTSETGPLLRLAPVAPAKAAATTPTALPRPASIPATVYTIKSGDTVSGIAKRFGLKTADLLKWNNLTWRSIIYPGQKLRLFPTGTTNDNGGNNGNNNGGNTGNNGGGGNDNGGDTSAAKYHTVVRGDTVYGIAKKYRTTVALIIQWNKLSNAAVIYPGQKLRVSAGTTTSGDNNNNNNNNGGGGGGSNDTDKATTHTVVAGDTLYGIAKKYGLTVDFLLRANGLNRGSIIYPGQVLRLTMPPSEQRSATLDATQKANAVSIIRIGRELGVPERGIAIALATAMVESSMRNLNHGDRDSLGLFQQRPSQGWGTREQITNVDRSIRVFYGGPQDPNGTRTRGLLDIRGWQAMAFTDAAQAVQISAYPDRYGQWEQQAYRWVAALR